METTMTNTTNKADTLRAAIKAAGYNARRVTVRYQHSELRVMIRDSSVSISAVKSIAEPFENVRKCQTTGEILLGGNTYVKVVYLAELVAPVAAQMDALMTTTAEGFSVDLPGGFTADRGGLDRWTLQCPGFDFRNNVAVGVGWAAQRIAVAYLDANAATTAGVGVAA
jgi:hypothetical protein